MKSRGVKKKNWCRQARDSAQKCSITGKLIFGKTVARHQAYMYRYRFNQYVREYQCSYCTGWHIGHYTGLE